MKPSSAELAITGRMLVLQSKRALLKSLERQLEQRSPHAMRQRIVRARDEVDRAQHLYRKTVLTFGTPASPEFWPIAYMRLIDVGNATVQMLRNSTAEHSPEERYKVAAEVEALETMISGWTESKRAAMVAAVA